MLGFDGNGNGSGTGKGIGSGTDEVIDFGGFGTGNGTHGGPLSAPTYDPPPYGEPEDPDSDNS